MSTGCLRPQCVVRLVCACVHVTRNAHSTMLAFRAVTRALAAPWLRSRLAPLLTRGHPKQLPTLPRTATSTYKVGAAQPLLRLSHGARTFSTAASNASARVVPLHSSALHTAAPSVPSSSCCGSDGATLKHASRAHARAAAAQSRSCALTRCCACPTDATRFANASREACMYAWVVRSVSSCSSTSVWWRSMSCTMSAELLR